MRMRRSSRFIIRIFTSLLALTLSLLACWILLAALGSGGARARSSLDTIIYVDGDATGGATGISWTDAYTDLQNALTSAGPDTEIWVAEGLYHPTNGSDRAADL